MEVINSYKDLIVWQKSVFLSVKIYKITEQFPKHELYGIVSQIRRCAVSIPSNIAEGRGRGTKKDYCRFLQISLGSSNELETQLEISKQLNYISTEDAKKLESIIIEVIKMLKTMIRKMKY